MNTRQIASCEGIGDMHIRDDAGEDLIQTLLRLIKDSLPRLKIFGEGRETGRDMHQ
jgi:hypothetical protein